MVPIRPVGERILIKLDPPEDKYEGSSLIIPETFQTPSNKATVLDVGQGRFNEEGNRIPLGVKPGDRIQIGPYSGVEWEYEGEKFYFITENYIEGIIE